jgi:hypothetical protein
MSKRRRALPDVEPRRSTEVVRPTVTESRNSTPGTGPAFLTVGTVEHEEVTRRYVIEAARIILRELSRLPRLFHELREVLDDERWHELWSEADVDGQLIDRLVKNYIEELRQEDDRLRQQLADLKRRGEHAQEQLQRVRLRRAEIKYNLGK